LTKTKKTTKKSRARRRTNSIMQLSQQQLAAGIAAMEKRLNSKKLEVDALDRLRLASGVLSRILPDTPAGPQDANSIQHAVENFLTAKINWLLIDVQEFELNIRALKSQQSGIVVPGPPVRPGG
jgi:hypothetical protein